MKTRIDCNFGNGTDTILFDMVSGNFFSYYTDRQELHRLYGGRNYYESRSGATGAGYLEPPVGHSLIEFGGYRVDAGYGHQYKKVVAQWGPHYYRRPVFGYVPYAHNGGLVFQDRETGQYFPIVLTDGSTVAFCHRWSVVEKLMDWDKVKKNAVDKSQAVYHIVPYPRERKLSWSLYNPDHLRGVNALRFVDLRDVQADIPYNHESSPPMTCSELRLVEVKDGSERYWLHISSLGILDQKIESNPLKTEGPVGVDGWVGDGKGMLWRRLPFEHAVEAFLELPWARARNHWTMDYPGHPEYVSVSTRVSELEWFRSPEKVRQQLLEEVAERAHRIYEGDDHVRQLHTKIRLARSQGMHLSYFDLAEVMGDDPAQALLDRLELDLDENANFDLGQILVEEKIDVLLRNWSFRRVVDSLWGDVYLVKVKSELGFDRFVIASSEEEAVETALRLHVNGAYFHGHMTDWDWNDWKEKNPSHFLSASAQVRDTRTVLGRGAWEEFTDSFGGEDISDEELLGEATLANLRKASRVAQDEVLEEEE